MTLLILKTIFILNEWQIIKKQNNVENVMS